MTSEEASRAPTGPRRLDFHQGQKIQEVTLKRYRSAVQAFTQWIDECEGTLRNTGRVQAE